MLHLLFYPSLTFLPCLILVSCLLLVYSTIPPSPPLSLVPGECRWLLERPRSLFSFSSAGIIEQEVWRHWLAAVLMIEAAHMAGIFNWRPATQLRPANQVRLAHSSVLFTNKENSKPEDKMDKKSSRNLRYGKTGLRHATKGN